MKKSGSALAALAAVAAALALITCSAEAMDGARRSLALCAEVLIPSLLSLIHI